MSRKRQAEEIFIQSKKIKIAPIYIQYQKLILKVGYQQAQRLIIHAYFRIHSPCKLHKNLINIVQKYSLQV